jgi:hypothetical protein
LALLTVQFIAVLMPLLAPVLGYITDTWGVLSLMQLLAGCSCSGIILIIVASSTETDALYYPAISLMGLSQVATSIIIVQTGLVFQHSMQQRVISLLNVLLHGGSIPYLILYKIYVGIDITLVTIATGYLGFSVFCYSGALVCWIWIFE